MCLVPLVLLCPIPYLGTISTAQLFLPFSLVALSLSLTHITLLLLVTARRLHRRCREVFTYNIFYTILYLLYKHAAKAFFSLEKKTPSLVMPYIIITRSLLLLASLTLSVKLKFFFSLFTFNKNLFFSHVFCYAALRSSSSSSSLLSTIESLSVISYSMLYVRIIDFHKLFFFV